MSRYDFTSVRLHVEADLGPGVRLSLDRGRTNYLANVLRMGPGDALLVFNGRDGEWRASVVEAGRKALALAVGERTRPQEPLPKLHYLFAPLKQARLDYMVQKAVEMGAGRLRPVLTRHTQVRRLNVDRAAANVREACEQCGVIAIPPVDEPADLGAVLDAWQPERILVVADEAESARPRTALEALAALPRGRPLAVLVGPEGGFAPAERERLAAAPFVRRIALGPRILRADTAAVAALALVQAAAGDWGVPPGEPESVP